MDKKIVSVYGYGRFGRLWADILSENFNVKVYSRRGLKPEEVSKKVEITDIRGLHNCDVLFYCVAISSFEEVLIESKDYLKKDCLYIDTCSVKVNPVEWMNKHLPSGSRVIATHPMFGPDSYFNASGLLPIVMSNISANHEEFDFWKTFFETKNMRAEIMTPDQHDEMVAYSQGITHYIGRVLADLELHTTPINTLGYTKLLEIIQQTCNDTWQLFCDLQKYNPYTTKMRKELHESIEKIYSILNKL